MTFDPENKSSSEEPEQNEILNIQTDVKLEYSTSPIKAAFTALISVFLLYQVGGALLTFLIFGMDFAHADINAQRLLTAGGQILLILAPALVFSKLVYNDNVTQVIRFRLPNFKVVGLFVLGMIPLLTMLQNFLYIQNYLIVKLANSNSFIMYLKKTFDSLDKFINSAYDELVTAHNVFEGILIVIIVAFIPAICEEVFFRGFVQKSFEQKLKPLTAGLITSIFFAIYHFNPYGLIFLTILAFYFSYAVYKTNSIFTSMILHFINNFLTVLLVFIFNDKELLESNVVDEKSIVQNLTTFILTLIFFIIYMVFVKKYIDKQKARLV